MRMFRSSPMKTQCHVTCPLVAGGISAPSLFHLCVSKYPLTFSETDLTRQPRERVTSRRSVDFPPSDARRVSLISREGRVVLISAADWHPRTANYRREAERAGGTSETRTGNVTSPFTRLIYREGEAARRSDRV